MTKTKKRARIAKKPNTAKGKHAALPRSEDERNRKVWEANERFLASGIGIKDVYRSLEPADRRSFGLNAAQWKDFLAELDAPPRLVPRLKRLLKDYGFFDTNSEHCLPASPLTRPTAKHRIRRV